MNMKFQEVQARDINLITQIVFKAGVCMSSPRECMEIEKRGLPNTDFED